MQDEFGLNVIVALNKYNTDLDEEIELVNSELKDRKIEMSVVEGWAKGGEGSINIAKKILDISKNSTKLNYTYNDVDNIKTKIEKVAQKIYGATGVEFLEDAETNIAKIDALGKSNLPICIAKTQYSLSDDDKNLECKEPFKITIRDVDLKNGAGFIVAYSGKILTMPGLPKIPAAENINIDEENNIVGIF